MCKYKTLPLGMAAQLALSNSVTFLEAFRSNSTRRVTMPVWCQLDLFEDSLNVSVECVMLKTWLAFIALSIL